MDLFTRRLHTAITAGTVLARLLECKKHVLERYVKGKDLATARGSGTCRRTPLGVGAQRALHNIRYQTRNARVRTPRTPVRGTELGFPPAPAKNARGGFFPGYGFSPDNWVTSRQHRKNQGFSEPCGVVSHETADPINGYECRTWEFCPEQPGPHARPRVCLPPRDAYTAPPDRQSQEGRSYDYHDPCTAERP